MAKKFQSHCRAILKRQQHKLMTFWRVRCNCDRSKPGPANIDPTKWAWLVDHFSSPDAIARSARMKKTRAKVIDSTRFGRGGVAAADKRLVRIA